MTQHFSKDFIENHFTPYLIKVAQKQQYIDDLLAGHIYLKEAGYFRKLEDNFRGDPNDGRRPIDLGDTEAYIEIPDTGERIHINGVPGVKIHNFSVGFQGDDKVPVFCAFLMEPDVLEITGEDSFRIKSEFLQELAKFGGYTAFVPLGEMMDKLREYNEAHKDIAFITSSVSYVDIMKEYGPDMEAEDQPFGDYQAFFIKDAAYAMQNEWRIVAVCKDALIDKDSDHWIADVGPFEYSIAIDMQSLLEHDFHVGKSEDGSEC